MNDITVIIKKTKTDPFGCIEVGACFEYQGFFYMKVALERGDCTWNAVDMNSGVLTKFYGTTEVYPLKARIEYDYIQNERG